MCDRPLIAWQPLYIKGGKAHDILKAPLKTILSWIISNSLPSRLHLHSPKMPVLDTLPPGVKYTLQGFPNTLVAPALVLVSAMLARNHLDIFLPTWAVIVAAGLSLPIGWLVGVKYRDWVDARDAAALGAVMPPVAYDPWPGSLSLFRMAVDDFKNGYAGVYCYGFRLHNLF